MGGGGDVWMMVVDVVQRVDRRWERKQRTEAIRDRDISTRQELPKMRCDAMPTDNLAAC